MISLFINSVPQFKSFYVKDIWNHINNNPDLDFVILKDYEIISNDDLCRLYLMESNSYKDYINLENILNKTNSDAFIQNLTADI